MQRRILLSLAAVLVVAACAATGIHFATRGDTIDMDGFPVSNVASTIQLRPGETLRDVTHWPDGITPQYAFADNTDGTVSQYWFRQNGTLEKAMTEGPQGPDGKRPLLRVATVAADGVTYLTDDAYTLAGVLIKQNRLTDPKTQERQLYFPSGALHKDQVIKLDDRGWKLFDEDVFRPDSTLAERLRGEPNNAWERKFYSEASVLSRTRKVSPFANSFTDTTYWENGRTVKRIVVQDSSQTKLSVRDKAGQDVETFEWSGIVDQSSLKVTVFDTNGKKRFEQWYDWKVGTDGASGAYRMWQVVEFNAAGDEIRMLYFGTEGTTIDCEIIYDLEKRGSFLRRKFRPDGTLETEEDVSKGTATATRTFTVEDNVRGQFDPELFRWRTYEAPAQEIKYNPPMHM